MEPELSIIQSQGQFLQQAEKRGAGITVHLNDSEFQSTIKINWNFSSVTFTNCVFKRQVTIESPSIRNEELPHEFNFRDCTFEKELDISEATFHGKVYFHQCHFNEINAEGSKFNRLVDFWQSTFHQPVIFYKTNFLDTTDFSACVFEENTLFSYTLIEKVIIFRSTRFLKGLDLSTAIITGQLNLFNTRIIKFKTLNVRKQLARVLPQRERQLQFEQCYENAISEEALIPIENQLETYRIMKKQYQDDGSVSFMPLKGRERNTLQKLHWQRLNPCISLEPKFKDTINNNWIDFWKWVRIGLGLFILLLNRVSNSHGQSYLIGTLFTTCISLLFFNLSLLGLEDYTYQCWSCWEWNWDLSAYYFQFLLPTHRPDYINPLGTPEPGYYAADFAGRVFVSYGIYQTVQAFRKYK